MTTAVATVEVAESSRKVAQQGATGARRAIPEGITALMYACQQNNSSEVRRIIQRKDKCFLHSYDAVSEVERCRILLTPLAAEDILRRCLLYKVSREQSSKRKASNTGRDSDISDICKTSSTYYRAAFQELSIRIRSSEVAVIQ